MKILIWIICFFVMGAVSAVLQNVGIYLGAIPTVLLFIGVSFVARHLCTMWDVKCFEKEAKKKGMTMGEYANVRFNRGFLQLCRDNLYDRSAMKKMLKNSVKEDVITKSEANVLLYIFNNGLWVS